MAVSTALDAVRLGSSEVAALYLGSDSVWTANAPGMVLVSPTSITHSGTSATLGANGQVTFTGVTSLSLNGVFSAGFDNYVLSIRYDLSSDNDIYMRLRVSGSDNSTANSYVAQQLDASSTSVNAARLTSNQFQPFSGGGTTENGLITMIYGPFLVQPTAMRSANVASVSSAFLRDVAGTHNQSTSYDGITIYPASANMTGTLQVYGVRS